jgi:hypothetical protein
LFRGQPITFNKKKFNGITEITDYSPREKKLWPIAAPIQALFGLTKDLLSASPVLLVRIGNDSVNNQSYGRIPTASPITSQ